MKVVKCLEHIPEELCPINIYFIGDIHEGNCNCNYSALKEAVKIIMDDPNAYWFGMGDYIEAITHTGDKSFGGVKYTKTNKS